MKTILAGSRSITSVGALYDAIRASGFEITEVVCGEARGVDAMGRWWAESHRIPVAKFPADWDKHGRQAGYLRNVQMGNYAEALIAIWDGRSRGTRHMIDIATKNGLKVYVHRVDR